MKSLLLLRCSPQSVCNIVLVDLERIFHSAAFEQTSLCLSRELLVPTAEDLVPMASCQVHLSGSVPVKQSSYALLNWPDIVLACAGMPSSRGQTSWSPEISFSQLSGSKRSLNQYGSVILIRRAGDFATPTWGKKKSHAFEARIRQQPCLQRDRN